MTLFDTAARLPLIGMVAALACSLAPASAHAIVQGTASTLGQHVVRIHAGHYCTGVAIARRLVATAGHCVSRSMRVSAGGTSIGIARVTKSATLDDGRNVHVSGDAAILHLAAPLPLSVTPATVGEGDGDSYTIAGYGTASEARRGAVGTLREARLVAAEPRALVDPNRKGSISASACFGDSGGPVLRGSALIGVISRAAHPHPRIACGHLTRWAPIVAEGAATAPAVAQAAYSGAKAEAPPRKRRAAKRSQIATVAGFDPARSY